jgi:hypothetical protein
MAPKSILDVCHDAAFKTEAPTLIRLHMAAAKKRFEQNIAQNKTSATELHAIVQTLDNAVWKRDGSQEIWSGQVFFLVGQLEKTALKELQQICASESERVNSLIASARGSDEFAQDYYPEIEGFENRRAPHVYIDEIKAIEDFISKTIERRYGT